MKAISSLVLTTVASLVLSLLPWECLGHATCAYSTTPIDRSLSATYRPFTKIMPKVIRRNSAAAKRQDTLHSSFFASAKKRKGRPSAGASISQTSQSPPCESSVAEKLAARLHTRPVYLTPDKASWYLHVKQWMPSSTTSPSQFAQEWQLHPSQRHALKLFGKTVYENRWSQSWGVSYPYSGATNVARPMEESTMVPQLLERANRLTEGLLHHKEDSPPYNGCLQNWYEPDHTIGLHADDEKALRPEFPIFSLSWGGTRRFLLRSRANKKEKTQVWLADGDLLVMGGTCQRTHQHEVPKFRKTMDPPTSDRINWTIRAFCV